RGAPESTPGAFGTLRSWVQIPPSRLRTPGQAALRSGLIFAGVHPGAPCRLEKPLGERVDEPIGEFWVEGIPLLSEEVHRQIVGVAPGLEDGVGRPHRLAEPELAERRHRSLVL